MPAESMTEAEGPASRSESQVSVRLSKSGSGPSRGDDPTPNMGGGDTDKSEVAGPPLATVVEFTMTPRLPATRPHFPAIPAGRVVVALEPLDGTTTTSGTSSYWNILGSLTSLGKNPSVVVVDVVDCGRGDDDVFELIITTDGSAVLDCCAVVDDDLDVGTGVEVTVDTGPVTTVVAVAAVVREKPTKVGRAMIVVKLAWVRPNCVGVRPNSFTRLWMIRTCNKYVLIDIVPVCTLTLYSGHVTFRNAN